MGLRRVKVHRAGCSGGQGQLVHGWLQRPHRFVPLLIVQVKRVLRQRAGRGHGLQRMLRSLRRDLAHDRGPRIKPVDVLSSSSSSARRGATTAHHQAMASFLHRCGIETHGHAANILSEFGRIVVRVGIVGHFAAGTSDTAIHVAVGATVIRHSRTLRGWVRATNAQAREKRMCAVGNRNNAPASDRELECDEQQRNGRWESVGRTVGPSTPHAQCTPHRARSSHMPHDHHALQHSVITVVRMATCLFPTHRAARK
jgi:hypothetical protein